MNPGIISYRQREGRNEASGKLSLAERKRKPFHSFKHANAKTQVKNSVDMILSDQLYYNLTSEIINAENLLNCLNFSPSRLFFMLL